MEQDRLLAQRIIDEGRACVIAVNKWDAIPDKTDKSYLEVEDHIRKSLPGLRFAEVRPGQQSFSVFHLISLSYL